MQNRRLHFGKYSAEVKSMSGRNPAHRDGWHRLLWDDFTAGASTLGALGSVNPDAVTLFGAGGIKGLAFDGGSTTEMLHGSTELLHGYAEGTPLRVHVHWMPTTADAGSVLWQLEYSILNPNEVATAPTIISAADPAAGAAWTHQVVGIDTITDVSMKIGSHLMYRIFRDPSESADDYTQDAVLMSVGIHAKNNSGGSRQEYIK
jgi:hypothetical protein